MRREGLVNTSVSHGTLVTDDLIKSFLDVLQRYDPENYRRLAAEDFRLTDSYDRTVFLNEDLFDAMNDIAPEGCYFGSHPGDGSDFGFWEQEEEW